MTTSVGSAVQQVVSGTTALPASSPGSPATSNNATLAGNFQTFLTLSDASGPGWIPVGTDAAVLLGGTLSSVFTVAFVAPGAVLATAAAKALPVCIAAVCAACSVFGVS